MSVIDTLIFDRTTADIINDTDKAYFSYLDLNRVETAAAYVAGLCGISLTAKIWTASDIRYQSALDMLLDTLAEIYAYVFTAAPGAAITELPKVLTLTSIEQANSIERMLHEAAAALDEVYLVDSDGSTYLVDERDNYLVV